MLFCLISLFKAVYKAVWRVVSWLVIAYRWSTYIGQALRQVEWKTYLRPPNIGFLFNLQGWQITLNLEVLPTWNVAKLFSKIINSCVTRFVKNVGYQLKFKWQSWLAHCMFSFLLCCWIICWTFLHGAFWYWNSSLLPGIVFNKKI